MTEPQEFSSDFDKWVCSLLDLLRAKGYTNVSVNRGRYFYTFIFKERVSRLGSDYTILHMPKIIETDLFVDYINKQTPKQILELIK